MIIGGKSKIGAAGDSPKVFPYKILFAQIVTTGRSGQDAKQSYRFQDQINRITILVDGYKFKKSLKLKVTSYLDRVLELLSTNSLVIEDSKSSAKSHIHIYVQLFPAVIS